MIEPTTVLRPKSALPTAPRPAAPPADQPRILHVTAATAGPTAEVVRSICLDQHARGWHTTVACPDGDRLGLDLAAGGLTRRRWQPERGLVGIGRAARRIHDLIDELRPDLIHLHGGEAGTAGRLTARGRVPALYQPYGWSWLPLGGLPRRAALAWERRAHTWTAAVVCSGVSEAQTGRVHGIRGRFAVVPPGVDLRRHTPATDDDRRAARIATGIDLRTPLVLCVGPITAQHGQDDLVQAWAEVHRADPRARLAIIGDGELLPRVRRSAGADVRFVAAPNDYRDWYAAADVVVVPWRWDGTPTHVVRALASGRSVVATDLPSLREVLPARAGALVPPGDRAALAGALLRRLREPALARAEGAAAAAYASTRFDVRRATDAVAALTLEVIGAAPRW